MAKSTIFYGLLSTLGSPFRMFIPSTTPAPFKTVISLKPSRNSTPTAIGFFQSYLAFPVIVVLYLGYKIWTRDWSLAVPIEKMDLATGVVLLDEEEPEEPVTWKNFPRFIYRTLF
ncbi:hypothetical protein V2G26_020009 [Clonostachys chloroleuca]